MQDDPVVPLDLEMLAGGLDPHDRATGPRHHTDQARGIEAHHLLVDERRPQRRSRAVDGVALGHKRTLRERTREQVDTRREVRAKGEAVTSKTR